MQKERKRQGHSTPCQGRTGWGHNLESYTEAQRPQHSTHNHHSEPDNFSSTWTLYTFKSHCCCAIHILLTTYSPLLQLTRHLWAYQNLERMKGRGESRTVLVSVTVCLRKPWWTFSSYAMVFFSSCMKRLYFISFKVGSHHKDTTASSLLLSCLQGENNIQTSDTICLKTKTTEHAYCLHEDQGASHYKMYQTRVACWHVGLTSSLLWRPLSKDLDLPL